MVKLSSELGHRGRSSSERSKWMIRHVSQLRAGHEIETHGASEVLRRHRRRVPHIRAEGEYKRQRAMCTQPAMGRASSDHHMTQPYPSRAAAAAGWTCAEVVRLLFANKGIAFIGFGPMQAPTCR